MIITTSWDDGHPLDMKLLELLEKYNIKATFYIPLSNPENPVMGNGAMVQLSKYQEIGAHTLNHTYLNTLNDKDAEYEITQCKVRLEEILDKPISAFCFPGGKYSDRDLLLIKKAGFLFGRTTKLLSFSKPNCNLLNTNIQAFNHSSATLLCHSIKNLNIVPMLRNYFYLPFNRNFLKLAEHEMQLKMNSNHEAVFHIWGHSYEIEQYNLWNQIENFFKLLKTYDNIDYLNNTNTWKRINKI